MLPVYLLISIANAVGMRFSDYKESDNCAGLNRPIIPYVIEAYRYGNFQGYLHIKNVDGDDQCVIEKYRSAKVFVFKGIERDEEGEDGKKLWCRLQENHDTQTFKEEIIGSASIQVKIWPHHGRYSIEGPGCEGYKFSFDDPISSEEE